MEILEDAVQQKQIYNSYFTYLLLVTTTGWYPTKHPMKLRPFTNLLCSPSEF
jgi:hypothetical protein